MCAPPESSSRAGPRALVAQHLVAHSVVIDRGCDSLRTNMNAAMYAATEMGPAFTGSQFSGITVHPGEDASSKEEDDWWRIFDGVLSATDAVHYIAGNDPPRLAHLLPVDNTGYSEVTVPADDTDPSYFKAIEHNRKVKAAVLENVRRKTVRDDSKWQSAKLLAAALDLSLRPKAASLLFRLQKAKRNATMSTALGTDVYDGHGMVELLRDARKAGITHPSKARSHEYHEEQYRIMRATRLPDGCASQEYADKCNELSVKHIPYFRTLRLEGELLSEAYLAFAPAALDSDMRGIADALRADGKMGDPEEAKLRATRRVAAAADPALEHARLALALGVAPPVAALKPTKPSAAGAGGGLSEGELKKLVERQVAAAVAGRPPPSGELSRRQQKAAERQNRGRLPDGQRCKAGTCDLAHDAKYPGKPCYSDPRVAIEVEFDTRHPDGVRPGYLARLNERRALEGKRLGVTPKPVTVARRGASGPPAAPLLPEGQFDGLDDWGQGVSTLAAFANPMHPLGVGPPVVEGTPIYYSLDELSALDDNCDECSEDEGEQAPTHYPPVPPTPPPPPPPDLRHWYVGRSPDGRFADARLLSEAECSELSAVGFQLDSYGGSAAGEMLARAAVASFGDEQAREARAAAALADSLAQRARELQEERAVPAAVV